MSRITVVFDAMRHGLKDGDKLTPDGEKQVRATAKANLSDRHYRFAFFSGMFRAQQTVMNALMAIECDTLLMDPVADEGFGYAWAEDDRHPIKDALEAIKAATADGTPETVDMWLQTWLPANAIRGRFRGTLEGWARLIATDDRLREKDESIHCLIGSHSPTGELACIDPRSFPKMNETDICRYTFEVDDETGEVMFVSTEYIQAPTA